jgi:hypothetical protein
MRTLLFLGVAALGLAACGGNVVVDVPGSGGTTTTTSTLTTTSTSTTTVTTTTSTTTTSTTTTTMTGCPVPFPGIDASCMVEGETCPVPHACCGGHAVCKGGVWRFEGIPCGQPCSLDCGPDGFSCSDGVCVAYIGTQTVYTCEKDPCPGPLSCSCAQGLCQQHGLTCNNIQMGFKVLCN